MSDSGLIVGVAKTWLPIMNRAALSAAPPLKRSNVERGEKDLFANGRLTLCLFRGALVVCMAAPVALGGAGCAEILRLDCTQADLKLADDMATSIRAVFPDAHAAVGTYDCDSSGKPVVDVEFNDDAAREAFLAAFACEENVGRSSYSCVIDGMETVFDGSALSVRS